MRILAIETSCDETAISLVEASGSVRAPRFRVRSNAVSSQIPIHRPFGGVVPNLAKREHQKNLPLVLADAMEGLGENESVDLLCVTVGPGLEPALWTGITFAQELKKKWNIPLVGVSHLEGHLCSFLLPQKRANNRSQITDHKKLFPVVQLVVSGGHTILIHMESLIRWKKLGETRDDAAGEAFDKVARMLGLPYPGGAEIEKLARQGDPDAIRFPRPMINTKDFDFSFSGLKTAVLYYLREHPDAKKNDVAAAFQAAAIDVLCEKTRRAAAAAGARSIILSGGVAANTALRTALRAAAKRSGAQFFTAEKKYHGDNAAMIAVAGYLAHLRGKKRALRANAGISL